MEFKDHPPVVYPTGRHVQEIRERLSISRNDMAEVLGYSRRQLYNVEHQNLPLPLPIVQRLNAYLSEQVEVYEQFTCLLNRIV